MHKSAGQKPSRRPEIAGQATGSNTARLAAHAAAETPFAALAQATGGLGEPKGSEGVTLRAGRSLPEAPRTRESPAATPEDYRSTMQEIPRRLAQVWRASSKVASTAPFWMAEQRMAASTHPTPWPDSELSLINS